MLKKLVPKLGPDSMVKSGVAMEAALKFKGYDYKYVWGNHGHSGKNMGAIFPDAMKWLWRQ